MRAFMYPQAEPIKIKDYQFRYKQPHCAHIVFYYKMTEDTVAIEVFGSLIKRSGLM